MRSVRDYRYISKMFGRDYRTFIKKLKTNLNSTTNLTTHIEKDTGFFNHPMYYRYSYPSWNTGEKSELARLLCKYYLLQKQ
jgi:hypothetical protein